MLEFRIGINVGDIIAEDQDVFGDEVNIAARLEGLAYPGGICVSSREDVYGNLEAAFDDIGEQQLKNIAKPIRTYRLRPKSGSVMPERLTPPPPDKPSIAVLPFQNMSGDPEKEYLADGIAEEITTALSRFKTLFVIARNSITYKHKATDARRIGAELGVRYVLEVSVRKGGTRLRITAQLTDSMVRIVCGAAVCVDFYQCSSHPDLKYTSGLKSTGYTRGLLLVHAAAAARFLEDCVDSDQSHGLDWAVTKFALSGRPWRENE